MSMWSRKQRPSNHVVASHSRIDRQVHIVLNLSVVTFLVLLGLSMVSPILPGYAESFQVSYSLVGLVISSFAVTRMLLDIPVGFLSRRHNNKIIMISGLILISISSIVAARAPNYGVLVLGRLIEGAGSALYVTTATAFLARIAGTERRGRLMSLYSGMLLLGSIFGPSFGGFIASVYDIRAPFYAYAIVTGLGLIPTMVLPKMARPEDTSLSKESSSSIHDVWTILSYPSFFLATLATFTLFFIRTGVRSTLVPLFAANNVGLDSSQIGLILTFAGVTTGVTMLPMGELSDKIGRRNPLILCLFLSAVLTLWIPYTSSMFNISICMLIYGASVGLSGPIAAFVTDVSPQDKLEVSMGLYRMISDMGFILGPLLLGYLADVSTTLGPGKGSISGQIGVLPFAVASIIMVVVGLLLFKAEDPVRRDRRKRAAL